MFTAVFMNRADSCHEVKCNAIGTDVSGESAPLILETEEFVFLLTGMLISP